MREVPHELLFSSNILNSFFISLRIGQDPDSFALKI